MKRLLFGFLMMVAIIFLINACGGGSGGSSADSSSDTATTGSGGSEEALCSSSEALGCTGFCISKSWIGDKFCDAALNCSAFNFDEGDCISVTTTSLTTSPPTTLPVTTTGTLTIYKAYTGACSPTSVSIDGTEIGILTASYYGEQPSCG